VVRKTTNPFGQHYHEIYQRDGSRGLLSKRGKGEKRIFEYEGGPLEEGR